jgi:hypothetical protein
VDAKIFEEKLFILAIWTMFLQFCSKIYCQADATAKNPNCQLLGWMNYCDLPVHNIKVNILYVWNLIMFIWIMLILLFVVDTGSSLFSSWYQWFYHVWGDPRGGSQCSYLCIELLIQLVCLSTTRKFLQMYNVFFKYKNSIIISGPSCAVPI